MLDIKIKVPNDILKLQIDKPIKNSIFEIAQDIRTDSIQNAPFESGTLRRSISINIGNKGYSATIGSNLVYAPIQEYGGTIEPTNGEYLHFKIGNKWIKKKRVNIRGKKYIGKAIEKNEKNIGKIFVKNLNDYFGRKLGK